MKQKFYVCKHCGNIAAMIRDKGVPLLCCGEKMQELIPGTAEASGEKHIPVYRQEGNVVHVTVGSVEHPMTKEHYIEWICLETEHGIQYAHLDPDDKPKAKFSICHGDEIRAVYAFCNQHDFMEEVSMSLINQEISDFRTYAYHENDFKFVSREDILGKWSVFFFYPADFTFVCPTELEDLADKYEQFRAIGCEVYSVSTDTHFVHKAWHDASDRIKKINYPMLADPTHAISKDFQVLIEADGLAERGTFIINPEGKIVGYEVTAGNVGRNAEELLRKVQACQFVHAHGDQVCPANWKPGAETLKPSLDLVGQL